MESLIKMTHVLMLPEFPIGMAAQHGNKHKEIKSRIYWSITK
jgi:hypothetical protein